MSADSTADLLRGCERFQLPFLFASDSGRTVMDRLGLRHAQGSPQHADIFYATLFLVSNDGIVRWKHAAIDVRDRATPTEILEAARSIRSQR